MASITFKQAPVTTCGDLPAVGSVAPDFSLTNGELQDIGAAEFRGQKLILNIVPSLDTGVCAASARRFNEVIAELDGTVVANVSMDLPFAQGRFCESEGLKNVVNLSAFRSQNFGNDYGVTILDGPLAGLFCRAVVVVDGEGQVIYTELVPEIAQEPDYDGALAAVR